MAGKGGQQGLVDLKVQMAHMPIPKVQGMSKDTEDTRPRGPATFDTRNPRNAGNFNLFDGGVKNAGQRRNQNYSQQSAQGYNGPVHPGARRVQGGPNQQSAGASQNANYTRGIPGAKPGCMRRY